MFWLGMIVGLSLGGTGGFFMAAAARASSADAIVREPGRAPIVSSEGRPSLRVAA